MELRQRVGVLLEALASDDAAAFVEQVQAALLEKSNFKALQEALGASHLAADTKVLLFFLRCLKVSCADGFIGAQPVSHLLLEIVPKPVPRQPEVVAAASETFLQCCRAATSRVAVKLAQVYGVEVGDLPLPAQPEVVQLIDRLLSSAGTAAAAVALLMQFPPLQTQFDVPGLLEELVEGGQLAVAIKWAAALGRESQVQYVNHCLQYNHLKSAARAVQEFGLQVEFPDVEVQYRRRTLSRLTAKGLWGVAATYVGEDATLQAELIQMLLVAGEACLAQEYSHLFKLDLAGFGFDEEGLAEERRRRAEAYLQLALPSARLHFVDTQEGLHAMRLALEEQLLLLPGRGGGAGGSGAIMHHNAGQGASSHVGAAGTKLGGDGRGQVGMAGEEVGPGPAGGGIGGERSVHHSWAAAGAMLPVVGVDVEWRPERADGQSGSSPASIMQVATDSDVFIVDLLVFGGSPDALDTVLGPILGSPRVYKLGVGVSSDIRKLGASYPAVAAFRTVHGCLDLGTLWKQRHVPHTQQQQQGHGTNGQAPGRRGGEMGLSALCETLLGKPLDKTMQVSDWERRPLMEQQLRYAALDAHAAVLIFRGLEQLNPAFSTHSGLDTYAFSVLLPPVTSHKRHRSEADVRRGEGGGDDDDGGSGGGGHSGAGLGGSAMDEGGTGGSSSSMGWEDGSSGAPAASGVCGGGSGQAQASWGCATVGASDVQLAAGDQLGWDGAWETPFSLAVTDPTGQGQPLCQELTPAHGTAPSPLGLAAWQQSEEQPSPVTLADRQRCTGSGTGGYANFPGHAGGLQRPDYVSLLPPMVRQHLRQHGLLSALLPLPTSPGGGGSIDDASAALGVQAHQVCKALAVMTQERGGAAVVVVPGNLRLSLRKVAGVMGWPKKSARLASRNDCIALFGYPPGTMPPFAYPSAVTVVFDQALFPPPSHASIPGAPSLQLAACGPSSGSSGPGEGAPFSSGCTLEDEEPWLFCGWGIAGSCLRLLPSQLRRLVPSNTIIADVCAPPDPSLAPLRIAQPEGQAPKLCCLPVATSSLQHTRHAGLAPHISGRGVGPAAGAADLRFLLDTMCTRLCRWLRCLGIDSEFVGPERPRHEVAALAARASHQGRVFLTRDQRLCERQGSGAMFLLSSDDAEAQLGELVRHFGIRFDEAVVMSRCSKCNVASIEQVLPRELARPHVPQHVYELVEEFFSCGNCGKIFWVGPKSQSALELMTGMLTRLGVMCAHSDLPAKAAGTATSSAVDNYNGTVEHGVAQAQPSSSRSPAAGGGVR